MDSLPSDFAGPELAATNQFLMFIAFCISLFLTFAHIRNYAFNHYSITPFSLIAYFLAPFILTPIIYGIMVYAWNMVLSSLSNLLSF